MRATLAICELLICYKLVALHVWLGQDPVYKQINNVLEYTPCFIKTTLYLIAHNFGKCWPIFSFFFTFELGRGRVMNWSLKVASHLVDTLPCEM